MRTILLWGLFLPALAARAADLPEGEYLSDLQHRLLHVQQGWGELGIDTCAHLPGHPGHPMKIGERILRKGLGHHAPGEIIVDLSGEYARFEAEVGLQPLGDAGSVVFKVFVDDEPRFDSRVLRAASPARNISIPVEGAAELRLVVEDAGDGIIQDCAHWGYARLIPSPTPLSPADDPHTLDVAPFAQVVTSDPERLDGSRASRIEAYRPEDLFLETEAAPDSNGRYIVPGRPGEPGCIGLTWLERRLIRQLGIVFEGPVPDPEGVRMECWVGGTAWQGGWKPLDGRFQVEGSKWLFRPDWSKLPEARGGTRKVRWIFPPSDRQPIVRRFSAMTPARLATADLTLQLERPQPGSHATVEIYNGRILEPAGGGSIQHRWDLSGPLALQVRYARPRAWRADRTVLRLRLPEAAFGVAVDDVLSRGAVYVRDTGLFVTHEGGPTLEEYRKEIEGRETVLQQVRRLPDQTFEAALAAIHHPAQNQAPMLVSLACDNNKFIVHRAGDIQFIPTNDPAGGYPRPAAFEAQMSPRFGSGQSSKITRRLEGGWLPAPTSEIHDSGLVYRQTAFVVPYGDTQDPGWLSPQPLGIARIEIENPGEASDAAVSLSFLANVPNGQAGELEKSGRGVAVRGPRGLLAWVELPEALAADISGGVLTLGGRLAAGATAEFNVYFPCWPADSFTPPAWDPMQRLKNYWDRVFESTLQIEVPDPLLGDVIRASEVHCLIAARNEAEGRRIAPWIASISYGPLESEANSIIRGLDVFGHHQFAQRSFDFFINRYAPEGFLTTGYTVMGTGWHLWTLGQHYQLTRNAAWLRSVAPEVAKVCGWVERQREGTKRLRASGEPVPEYGLMPPGVMADWNAFAYYFCLNGYYCAGLRDVGAALGDIGFEGADRFVRSAEEFQRDILRGYRWTQALMPVYPLRDGTSVPGYPSQLHGPGPTSHFFPGEDENRSWCYDVELGGHQLVAQGVKEAATRDVENMMDHMEDVQFLADGWFDFPAEKSEQDPFNLGGFSKVQPYYCRNGEIYALRDEVKPFVRSYFNSLASLLNLENLSLQEHFAGVAAWNKTHETGYFLLHSRLMLIQERGEELWLAAFITDRWLEDGKLVAVRNAPTHFGPITYRIDSAVGRGFIEATIEPPVVEVDRPAISSIVLRLRHPEGKPIVRIVPIEGAAQNIELDGHHHVRIRNPEGRLKLRAEFR